MASKKRRRRGRIFCLYPSHGLQTEPQDEALHWAHLVFVQARMEIVTSLAMPSTPSFRNERTVAWGISVAPCDAAAVCTPALAPAQRHIAYACDPLSACHARTSAVSVYLAVLPPLGEDAWRRVRRVRWTDISCAASGKSVESDGTDAEGRRVLSEITFKPRRPPGVCLSQVVHACAGFVEAGCPVRHQRLRPPAGVRRGARKAEGVLDTSAPSNSDSLWGQLHSSGPHAHDCTSVPFILAFPHSMLSHSV
ncbi:hypothetical protein VTO73DRAFT_12975 [Trametes versicolor]